MVMPAQKTTRRKRRRVGKPNTLSPDVAAAFKMAEANWGPCMKALPSDKHRAFCLALYELPRVRCASKRGSHGRFWHKQELAAVDVRHRKRSGTRSANFSSAP